MPKRFGKGSVKFTSSRENSAAHSSPTGSGMALMVKLSARSGSSEQASSLEQGQLCQQRQHQMKKSRKALSLTFCLISQFQLLS